MTVAITSPSPINIGGVARKTGEVVNVDEMTGRMLVNYGKAKETTAEEPKRKKSKLD